MTRCFEKFKTFTHFCVLNFSNYKKTLNVVRLFYIKELFCKITSGSIKQRIRQSICVIYMLLYWICRKASYSILEYPYIVKCFISFPVFIITIVFRYCRGLLAWGIMKSSWYLCLSMKSSRISFVTGLCMDSHTAVK